jgi:hypothetical protein
LTGYQSSSKDLSAEDTAATKRKSSSIGTTSARKKRHFNEEFVPDVSPDCNLVFSKRLLGGTVSKCFMRQVVWLTFLLDCPAIVILVTI